MHCCRAVNPSRHTRRSRDHVACRLGEMILAMGATLTYDISHNTSMSDPVHRLMNESFQRIEFLCTNIAQDKGIIVGRETCPAGVAKPRLPYPGQACHTFGPTVRHTDSLDCWFVTSFENVDKSAI